MTFLLIGSVSGTLLGFLMGFLSLFLILLILIQRGKGGGLTGALGGPGGQSAFGSKAGDTFTVITVVVAAVWGFTCAFTMWLLGTHAPSPIADSAMSAGPGDQAPQTGNELVIPPMGGFDGASLSGADADAELTETPEPAMVPAETTTPAAEETTAEEPEETTAE
ncbi:MAG: preprotein translocase subunit SecG [Rubripirellula sp.]